MSLPLRFRPLAFMDTETTGLIPETHELLEVAIVKRFPITGARHVYHTLVKPQRIEEAEDLAMKCNGYLENQAKWEDAPSIDEVTPKILEFLDGTILVGHNIRYDMSMINGVLARAGSEKRIPHHRIDTVALCFEHLVPLGLTSVKLDTVREFLYWKTERPHTAMMDTLDAERLYNLLNQATWFTRLRIRVFRALKMAVR